MNANRVYLVANRIDEGDLEERLLRSESPPVI